jgi:hypothetical protein
VGNQIDFVIIDTVHLLPGEILDFLCILPYLSEHATVILHDVNMNYAKFLGAKIEDKPSAKDAVATKILFTTVTGKKYDFCDEDNIANIAAFTLNEDTKKYVKDLFFALSLTWSYMPSDEMLTGYRNVYKDFYERECLELFDIAVRNNKEISDYGKTLQTYLKTVKEYKLTQGKYTFPYEEVSLKSKIALYGAGYVGKDYFQQIEGYCDVILWVDKKYEEISYDYNNGQICINSPDKLYETDFDYVVVAIKDKSVAEDVCKELIDKGIEARKVIWKQPIYIL